jgi:hypothetical protein
MALSTARLPVPPLAFEYMAARGFGPRRAGPDAVAALLATSGALAFAAQVWTAVGDRLAMQCVHGAMVLSAQGVWLA